MDFFNIDRFKSNDFSVYHNPNASYRLPLETLKMFSQFVPESIDDSRFTLRNISRGTA